MVADGIGNDIQDLYKVISTEMGAKGYFLPSDTSCAAKSAVERCSQATI